MACNTAARARRASAASAPGVQTRCCGGCSSGSGSTSSGSGSSCCCSGSSSSCCCCCWGASERCCGWCCCWGVCKHSCGPGSGGCPVGGNSARGPASSSCCSCFWGAARSAAATRSGVGWVPSATRARLEARLPCAAAAPAASGGPSCAPLAAAAAAAGDAPGARAAGKDACQVQGLSAGAVVEVSAPKESACPWAPAPGDAISSPASAGTPPSAPRMNSWASCVWVEGCRAKDVHAAGCLAWPHWGPALTDTPPTHPGERHAPGCPRATRPAPSAHHPCG